MIKLILGTLLLSFTVFTAVKSTAITEEHVAPVASPAPTPVAAKKWIELDDGSRSGTKISVDVTSFEVISAEDVFEFIVFLEFAQPQQVETESVVATIASVQISCKQKVVATVRDFSINEQQQNVLPNMLAQGFGVQKLEKGSHFGNIAEFICTRGGTLDGNPKVEPKSGDRRQAERDA